MERKAAARMYPLPPVFSWRNSFSCTCKPGYMAPVRDSRGNGAASEEGVSRAEDSVGRVGNDSQRSLSLVARNSTRAFLEFPGSSELRRGYKFCTHISMETTAAVADEKGTGEVDTVERDDTMADS